MDCAPVSSLVQLLQFCLHTDEFTANRGGERLSWSAGQGAWGHLIWSRCCTVYMLALCSECTVAIQQDVSYIAERRPNRVMSCT